MQRGQPESENKIWNGELHDNNTTAGRMENVAKWRKKQMEEKPSIPLLEYKPENMFSTRSATAPLFAQSSIEIQTSPATPTPTGHKINQELKNLVNQLHAAHPKSKLHIGTFRSAITKKLRELGVDAAHSTTYINKMRAFYDEIYAASNGIEAAGGVM